MPQALSAAGDVLGVDRIIVVEFAPGAGKEPCLMLRYQWTQTGIMPFDQALLSDFRLDNPDITKWLAPLRRGEHLSSSRPTTNVTVARIFEKLKLASILLMPIIVEGHYWGHLGFYSSDSILVWSGREIDILRLLANSIGAGIQRADRIKRLAETIDTLGLSNTLLTEVIESSADGILVANNINKILAYNHRFLEMWNISPEEAAAGINEKLLLKKAVALKDPEAYVANIRFQHAHPTDVSLYETEFEDGRVFNERTTALRRKDGGYLGRIWFYCDTTARKAAEEKVVRLSRTDHLTDLPNRRVFIEALQRAISRAGRGGKHFAILYLDLDHFKDVNDTLGHKVGDDLLVAVGKRILSTARAGDVVARFGGDEFAILQTDIQDPTHAAILATALLDAMAKPFSIGSNEIQSGTSIGITIGGPETTDSELLLSHADLALYGAKSEGRGGYRFFAESMDTEVHARVKLVSELRGALAEQQMALYYQPQVDTRDGQIRALEALIRWNHPKRGLVLPAEFIRIAELTGMIAALGQWVRIEAFRQMRQWLDAGIAPPILAINVSAMEFKIAGVEDRILSELATYDLPLDRIEIEITERTLMEASGRPDNVLAKLRQAGVRLCIDDFGTGYSSLAYMKLFRPDGIKIAGEFVSDMLENDADRAVVKAIIGIAHALGIHLIAEHVETAAQAKFLRDLGCCEVQGFAFSRALPAADITTILRRKKVFALLDRLALPVVA